MPVTAQSVCTRFSIQSTAPTLTGPVGAKSGNLAVWIILAKNWQLYYRTQGPSIHSIPATIRAPSCLAIAVVSTYNLGVIITTSSTRCAGAVVAVVRRSSYTLLSGLTHVSNTVATPAAARAVRPLKHCRCTDLPCRAHTQSSSPGPRQMVPRMPGGTIKSRRSPPIYAAQAKPNPLTRHAACVQWMPTSNPTRPCGSSRDAKQTPFGDTKTTTSALLLNTRNRLREYSTCGPRMTVIVSSNHGCMSDSR